MLALHTHAHTSLRVKWSLARKNVYLFSNKIEKNNERTFDCFLCFDFAMILCEMENAIFKNGKTYEER